MMNASTVKHPLIRFIAMIVAVLLLWVQLAVAFHHHHPQFKAKDDTTLGSILTGTSNATCAICHYLMHQAQSGLPRFVRWLSVAGILLLVLITPDQRKSVSGFRFNALNKGPPVSFL